MAPLKTGGPRRSRPVYFLLHVPKCAGTTVEDHFATVLGPGFMRAPRWESVARNFIGNRYDFKPRDPRLRHIHVVSGHSLSVSLKQFFPPGREIREAVLIRDPLSYLLSFYNYRIQRHLEHGDPQPPAFEKWYRRQGRNQIAHFILDRYFEQAVPVLYLRSSAAQFDWLEERLSQFWFVGGHERAGELIRGVCRDRGWPDAFESRNVTRTWRVTADDLPRRLIDRITEDNALDQALYDRWHDRGWRDNPTPRGGKPPALPRHDHLAMALRDGYSNIVKRLGR